MTMAPTDRMVWVEAVEIPRLAPRNNINPSRQNKEAQNDNMGGLFAAI